MFTKDKIKTRINLVIRHLTFHFVFWYCANALFRFFTDADYYFQGYISIMGLDPWYLTNFFLSLGMALIFTLVDGIFNDRLMRYSSVKILIIIPLLLYILIGAALAYLAPLSIKQLLTITTLEAFKSFLPTPNVQLTKFIVFFILAGFMNSMLQRINKKIGKSNFRTWLFGMMNKPREAERIFMFIDMRSSTRIAEQLSHEKFSHLIQDIFNDMAIFDNYYGEIYQYLGDGAVVSWPVAEGLMDNNCLKAFFGFMKIIQKREKYYQQQYGLIPKFKAAIHVGKVMVLQVGRIRRDISYNGDILNTTARIESMCNTYNRNLLISSDLYEMMHEHKDYYIKELDRIQLKGKRKKVGICYVREKKVTAKTRSFALGNLWKKLLPAKKVVEVPGEVQAA